MVDEDRTMAVDDKLTRTLIELEGIKQAFREELNRPAWMRGICIADDGHGTHLRINVGTEQDKVTGYEAVTDLMAECKVPTIRVVFEAVGDIVAQNEIRIFRMVEGKYRPAEQWAREGKPEWRDLLRIELDRRKALALIEELATLLGSRDDKVLTLSLMGELTEEDE